MVWATFWTIFSQTHLVTLVRDQNYKFPYFGSTTDFDENKSRLQISLKLKCPNCRPKFKLRLFTGHQIRYLTRQKTAIKMTEGFL
jgi:hypothetical protein